MVLRDACSCTTLPPNRVRTSSSYNRTSDASCIHTGFENAKTWLADVREHADPHLTCILVGNKVDLSDETPGTTASPSTSPAKTSHLRQASSAPRPKRQVSYEEAERWAKEEGLLFTETSAKSGENVEAAFEQAARDILTKIKNGVFDDDRVRSLFYLLFSFPDAYSSGILLWRATASWKKMLIFCLPV